MSADNPQDTHHEPPQAGDELLDELLPDHARDLLISRVIDGRASADDWDRFRKLAAYEPAIWCELADTQHQHESVREELMSAISMADSVELPGGMIDNQDTRRRMSLASKWGGWAVAAALVLAWSLGTPGVQIRGENPEGTQVAGLPGAGLMNGIGLKDAAPEQAFEQYLSAGQQQGRVIAEMPEQVVVETNPQPDGSIEVVYLRQIIERRVVDGAYRQVRDETGNAVSVPVSIKGRSIGAY